MSYSGITVKGLEEETFKDGENILEHGKVGSKVYVLTSGMISVISGTTEVFRTDEEGTILGEISVLLGVPHTATVKAQGDVTVSAIADLDAYFKENPESCTKVARTLAARVLNMNEHFLRLKEEMTAATAGSETQGHGKVYDILVKMDAFLIRDVMHPMLPVAAPVSVGSDDSANDD